MDIGTIITKYCDEHGMSSTEFANRVGVSRAYIYMLKRGKRYKAEKDVIPSVDTIEKIAKNLGFKPKNQCSIASEYIIKRGLFLPPFRA